MMGAGGKLLTVAALAGALAVPAVVGSVAQAEPAARDQSVLVTGNFVCQVPRAGHGDCTADRFNVPSGHYVRVENVSSGNKAVKFFLYNRNGHHLLGETASVSPAAGKKLIWRNDTSQTIAVEFEAQANAGVNVTCNAKWHETAT